MTAALSDIKISVIGLGYVGLPLAVALARHFDVCGFDISSARIDELRAGDDRTGEIDATTMSASTMSLSDDPQALAGSEIFIVTVPTPVDSNNEPDLGNVMAASGTVAPFLGKDAVVVFESTVYPGVTEDICGPILEKVSGLKCGRDFFLGYSPERINPGDKEHTVERITKVVAGQTPAVAERLAAIYGAVNGGNVFVARNIRTAEAAKVIENAQRDINIAFINELAMIFSKIGISTHDVLAAAGTKWNFLPFTPGLVGGHCIGVDPYYLANLATQLGHDPEVILTGRRINEQMAAFIADRIHDQMGGKPGDVLMLGLTFKENVPDLRNSKSADLAHALEKLGHRVAVHDPHADPLEAEAEHGITLVADLRRAGRFDCIAGTVVHDEYKNFSQDFFAAHLAEDGLVADIKGMWRGLELPAAVRRWSL